MCTLIVLRPRGGALLRVAANRDERLDRPSERPGIRKMGGRRVLAPRDLQGGGTWLGLNASGLFVGITNRFGLPLHPDRRSRGALVETALAQGRAAEAAEAVCRIGPRASNGYHMLCADLEEVWRIWSDGEALHRERLDPGVHVLSERSLGAAPTERERTLRRKLQETADRSLPDLGDLARLLAIHEDAAFEGTCVHLPALGYGTRSSTLIELGPTPSRARFLHAEGPPCRSPYEDLSERAAALLET